MDTIKFSSNMDLYKLYQEQIKYLVEREIVNGVEIKVITKILDCREGRVLAVIDRELSIGEKLEVAREVKRQMITRRENESQEIGMAREARLKEESEREKRAKELKAGGLGLKEFSWKGDAKKWWKKEVKKLFQLESKEPPKYGEWKPKQEKRGRGKKADRPSFIDKYMK